MFGSEVQSFLRNLVVVSDRPQRSKRWAIVEPPSRMTGRGQASPRFMEARFMEAWLESVF